MNLISEEMIELIVKNQNLDVTDDVKKLIVAAINSIDTRQLAPAISAGIDQFKAQEDRRRPGK